MGKLDDITVKASERKAPGTSVTDLAYLYGKIQKGAIFHNFSEQERKPSPFSPPFLGPSLIGWI